MTTGIVTWFNHLRGFGFIEPDDSGPDVFITIRAIERSGLGHVDAGRRVRYKLMPSATGGRCSTSRTPRSFRCNMSRRL